MFGIDVGRDAPSVMSCRTAAECNDGFACTIDSCGVGNVCDHVPVDSECAMGERCDPARGCVTGTPTDCERDSDCDDGRRCTGREQCLLGMCRVTEPYVCDDGNACTEDRCDGTTDDCVFTPTCDGGVVRVDAGPLCTPFDAASVYTSEFAVSGASPMSCGGAMYTLSPLRFSVSGGTLTASARGITMTQSPAPSGTSFDVRGSAGCATYRLTGTFDCGNTGSGRFTATFDTSELTCGFCRDVDQPVTFTLR
ncbi:MAG: hypothetical protein OHK0013_04530 [Sandaracinaceae bacterium]